MVHGLLSLIAGVVIIGLVVLCLSLFAGIRLLGGGGSGPRQQRREEQDMETKMIQEIYQGLSRLEDRVESLETLLMDKDREYDERK